MLKQFCIISCVSVLFFFGLTLIPVSVVFADDGLASQCEKHANKRKRRPHVTCLRTLLKDNAPDFVTPSRDGLGNWGCGSKNRAQHVGCLEDLLHAHTAGSPGMSPSDPVPGSQAAIAPGPVSENALVARLRVQGGTIQGCIDRIESDRDLIIYVHQPTGSYFTSHAKIGDVKVHEMCGQEICRP